MNNNKVLNDLLRIYKRLQIYNQNDITQIKLDGLENLSLSDVAYFPLKISRYTCNLKIICHWQMIIYLCYRDNIYDIINNVLSDYKDEFLINTNKFQNSNFKNIDDVIKFKINEPRVMKNNIYIINNCFDIITTSFSWELTREGHNFWKHLHQQLNKIYNYGKASLMIKGE